VAVWRPASGTWFIINSGGAPTSVIGFGANGDVPVASAFQP
jgi:hypothetical protein